MAWEHRGESPLIVVRTYPDGSDAAAPSVRQEFTLVHFSAQLERFEWNTGCT
jgi:hypothetical protein